MRGRLWCWIPALAISASILLTVASCGSSGSAHDAAAPPIPHAISDNQICKDCHATGKNGAPVVHDDRGSCLNCHTPTK